MAGFSGAAIGVGLLSGINNNIEKQRDLQLKEQQEQDAAQLQAFTKAQEEDQTARSKLADSGRKEDAMAKMLAANIGQPVGPWAYATARDAVEMGYTDMEHLPYVLDAAKRTFADQQSNPDKWGVPDTSPKKLGGTDSNPQQTALLRKMGNQMTPAQLEDIRQHNLTSPHSGLPGAAWGDPNDVINKEAATKKKIELNATNDANNQNFFDSTGLGKFSASGQPTTGQSTTSPNQASAIQDAVMRESGAKDPSQLQNLVIKPDANQMQPQTNQLAISGGDLAGPGTPPPAQAPQQAAPMATAQGQGAPATAAPPQSPQQQPQISVGQQGMQANVPPPPEMGQQMASAAPPPASPQAQATPQAPAIQPFKGTPALQPDTKPQLHPEALEGLPQSTIDNVKGVADGSINIKDLLSGLRGPQAVQARLALFAAVKAYDPSWNEQMYNARQKQQTEYANPDSAINRTMLYADKLSNHLSDLDRSVDMTGNEHMPGAKNLPKGESAGWTNPTTLLNNWTHSEFAGSTSPQFAPLRNSRQNVGEEASKFYGGGTGNVTAAQEFEKNFPDYMTPEYGHTATSQMAKSMLDQIIPMQAQQDRLMGPHTKTLADPATIAKLEKLAGVPPGYKPDTPAVDNSNVPTLFGKPMASQGQGSAVPADLPKGTTQSTDIHGQPIYVLPNGVAVRPQQ